MVMHSGAVDSCIRLIKYSTSDEVRSQCIWALANISGDSRRSRDHLLNLGALDAVAHCFEDLEEIPNAENISWAISNFFRFKPRPSVEVMKCAFPLLSRLLSSDNHEVLDNVCSALSYISDGNTENIQALIDGGFLPRLIDLLGSSQQATDTPLQYAGALSAIGNVLSGDEHQTQEIVKYKHVIPRLCHFIEHGDEKTRKEAAWSLSNIAAGTEKQIQSFISSGTSCMTNPMATILRAMNNERNPRVVKELTWILSNAIDGGALDQLIYFVKVGFVQTLHRVINDRTVSMDETVDVAMKGLHKLLQRCTEETSKVVDRRGHASIDIVNQNHNSDVILILAESVLEGFANQRRDGSLAEGGSTSNAYSEEEYREEGNEELEGDEMYEYEYGLENEELDEEGDNNNEDIEDGQ